MLVECTFYPSLLATSTYQVKRLTWSEMTQWLRSFPTRPTKSDSDPAFGPYVLPAGVRRSNEHVVSLTMAVFDVDQDVTEAKVAECDQRLGSTLRLWYPSASHTPTTPRYRLVIPLIKPVPAATWKLERAGLIDRYAIPADLNTSNSVSHSYFVPSGPVNIRSEGHVALQLNPWGTKTPKPLPTLAPTWTPKEDLAPIDLEPLRKRIQTRAAKLHRDGDHRRAEWLENLVAGRPLAEHGLRDEATTRTAALLVYLFPDAGLNTLAALFEESVEAMAAAGSKIHTLEQVEAKLESAMRMKARRDAAAQDILKHFDMHFKL